MTLNRRIFITFFPIFLLLLSGSVLSYVSFLVYRSEQGELYRDNLTLNRLTDRFETMKRTYVYYLEFKKFEDLDGYLKESALLKEIMLELEGNLAGNEQSLLLKDILGMMETYLELSDQAVIMKRNRLISEYYKVYLDSLEIDQYIVEFTGRYNNMLLQKNAIRYRVLESKVSALQRLFFTLIFFLSGISLFLMNYLSSLISRPVRDMTERAVRIAEGDFDTQPVIDEGAADELQNLSSSFTTMAGKIYENLLLKDALYGEEMKNLEMRENASKAEFFALQSQINPHFMFNTLNAGVQLAMFEEAEGTENFLNTFAKLLRYSLRNLQEPADLDQELENVRLYLDIMKIRYGNIFDFQVEEANTLTTWKIPRTILQPIIENIFVHALRSVDFLHIKIILRESQKGLTLQICDNGPGFSDESLRSIRKLSDLGFNELANMTRGKIGLLNVYFRFFLFFKEGFEMTAENRDTGGEIRILIPKKDIT
ncbi:MAG: hypothetical protein B6241_15290 [Spirochaetaceae bacterium 4572_59]|nr:MAG: hypothetical protein B6241_15290 [Spirochaetaceae bacterium 4572_59]